MTQPSDALKSETYEVDGHVVTRACRRLPESGRWEPSVAVRAAWNAGVDVRLGVKPEDCPDTPEDAMAVAARLAADWLQANAPKPAPEPAPEPGA